ncbi:MAG: hypothetical protein HY698_01960 [Deltaproteobacteria bacterium]|nr:hypothetical protein [Deltaproteobacteria bacterium]
MTQEDARLRAIGVTLVTDEENPRVHAECMRIARRLRQHRARIIGMLPASADVAVPPIALQLGLAFMELTGATIAVVDANVRWPAFSSLVSGEPVTPDESLYATRWLRSSLAVLTPPHPGDAGAGLPELARMLRGKMDLFAYVLVDLSGFDVLGEHLAAVDCVEGIIVVASAGRTTSDQLLRLQRELPASRHLGVLLAG